MATDRFKNHSAGLTSPASKHFGITPDDGADLAEVPRAIFIGGAGDIVIRDSDGTDATYTIAAAPFILPFRAVRILLTGTTATNLVGLTDP